MKLKIVIFCLFLFKLSNLASWDFGWFTRNSQPCTFHEGVRGGNCTVNSWRQCQELVGQECRNQGGTFIEPTFWESQQQFFRLGRCQIKGEMNKLEKDNEKFNHDPDNRYKIAFNQISARDVPGYFCNLNAAFMTGGDMFTRIIPVEFVPEEKQTVLEE
jgi:hypothetical protein